MPSKYILRNLKENCIYHIYNKSMSGEAIFKDTQDYRVFLFYLYIYTHRSEDVAAKFSDLPKRLKDKTLVSQMNLMAFSLLPDHFHLVIWQIRVLAMPKLMKQVSNGYTVYFNQKYNHQGPVFGGRYKATEVDNNLLPELVRFIHREPIDKKLVATLKDYEWSSYRKYTGQESFLDCDTNMIMGKIGTQEKFVTFHNNLTEYRQSLAKIKHMTIEDANQVATVSSFNTAVRE